MRPKSLRTVCTLSLLALTLPLVVRPAAAQQNSVGAAGTPPPLDRARPLVLPSIVQQTLPNGMRLVLLEDHRQPALWLRLAVPAGSIRDPKDRVGMAEMTASLLDKGAGNRTATQIADLVDGIGASLVASAGDDFLSISATGLSAYTDTLFDLLADVAQRPTFPAEELERTRTRVLNELNFSLSQPGTMAAAAIDRLVYGTHPYGNFATGTPKTLATITQEDLVQFHNSYFAPNVATLFMVGDITPAQALAKATTAFGTWAKKDVPAPPAIQTGDAKANPSRPRITVIDRPGAAQTEIRIGLLTTGYNDPNRIVGSVGTAVLGLGQFEGRLTREIRVKRGLTYGAESFFNRHQEAGEFEISTFTKNASTGEVVKIALDEANKMTTSDTPANELADRKTFLTGSFAVSVATPNGVLTRLVPAVLYGNGPQDLTTYTDQVMAVTPGQIRDVMSSLNLSAPQIVLVGDAKAIADQVKPLGSVRVLRYDSVDLLSPTLQAGASTPVPSKPTATAATPEELAAGQVRLAAVIKAHGGDAFLNIKTMQIVGKGSLTPPGLGQKMNVESLNLTIASPDKGRLVLKTDIGEVLLGVPGGTATPWMSVLGQVQDAPDDFASLISLFNPGQALGSALQKGFPVRSLPDATGGKPVTSADGKPLAGLSITDDHGNVMDIYAEQETHLVRRLIIHSSRGEITVMLGGYHATDGVQLPEALRLDLGPTNLFDFTFNSIVLNKPVDEKPFARPQQ